MAIHVSVDTNAVKATASIGGLIDDACGTICVRPDASNAALAKLDEINNLANELRQIVAKGE